MTDAALRAQTQFTLDERRWSKLRERVRKKSLRRNAIAHGQIFYDHVAKLENRKMFIATPSTLDGLQDRIYENDLIQIRSAFLTFSDDLLAFWQDTRESGA